MHFWNIPHIWMLYVGAVLAVASHYYSLYAHRKYLLAIREVLK